MKVTNVSDLEKRRSLAGDSLKEAILIQLRKFNKILESRTTDGQGSALHHVVGGYITLFLTLLIPPSVGISKPCISSGTETAIIDALSAPYAEAVLCRRSQFQISRTIVLNSEGQKLYTQGHPRGSARATLKISDSGISSIVFSRASKISISNLILDGAREELGRAARGGDAMIEVGGDATDITVDHVRASNPRGWSVIHIFEGGNKCSDARVTNNDIGPAGHPDRDWADGISFACKHGLIANNRISDASDGGIVVFGAPGTIVTQNLIRTTRNTLLGGVNLVDYKPYEGDYNGVVISENIIDAQGGYIKVGIAAGPAVWGSANSGLKNRGAVITRNQIRGNHIGFGIAVDGVENFTVTENRSSARYSGSAGSGCRPGVAPPGHAFVRNEATTQGTFQSNFSFGILDYLICYSELNHQHD